MPTWPVRISTPGSTAKSWLAMRQNEKVSPEPQTKVDSKAASEDVPYNNGYNTYSSWVVKNAFEKNQLEECVRLTEGSAMDNLQCAELYGDMLMYGVWDLYQMRYDLIRGNLAAPAEDPSKDQYLILPRNPQLAIEYYKMAAEADPDSSKAKQVLKRAQAKIEYCSRNGYAGMKKSPPDYSIPISDSVKHFLDRNAKSAAPADMEASRTFQPLPDFRPKLQDPRKEIFKNMAGYLTRRSFLQLALFSVLTFGIGHFVGIHWSSSIKIILATYGWPLILFMVIAKLYAGPQGVPVCSCKDLREAHEKVNRDFKVDDQNKDLPFDKAPFFVRHAHHGKHAVFWIYSLVSTILIFGYDWINRNVVTLPFDNTSHMVTISLALNMLIPSLIIMYFDKSDDEEKTFSSLHGPVVRNSNELGVIMLVIILICSYFLPDSDCMKESKKTYRKETIEKLIAKLE